MRFLQAIKDLQTESEQEIGELAQAMGEIDALAQAKSLLFDALAQANLYHFNTHMDT